MSNDKITLDDILEAKQKLDKLNPNKFTNPFEFKPLPFRVLESEHLDPLEPKIKLSENIDLSPEVRNRVNKYLLDNFGMTKPMILESYLGFHMHPTTRRKLLTPQQR